MNTLLLTDSYKFSHWKQYPPDTKFVYSYLESRGGRFPSTCFFGLQYILKKYLTGNRVSIGDVENANWFVEEHIGKGVFNKDGWMHIARKHLGALPVRIRAVAEGSVIPTGNVLMTVENTDPEVPWLTNYLETILTHVWYPTTVATQSLEIQKLLEHSLEKTGTPGASRFMLHDFGFRGVSSVESAAVGGCAHLVPFRGSDNPPGILMAREFYGEKMAGTSIAAAEHSTIMAWGRGNERQAFEHILGQYPIGFLAVVSDTEDIFHACSTIWGEELKDKVLARDGVLVVRPDSGKLPETLTTVLHLLAEKFGYSVNKRGCKVLNPHVRVIQGDGVNYDSIKLILDALERGSWSADNIAFGMGGALLQKLNRDTQKFAFKAAYVAGGNNGQVWQRDIFKSPIGEDWKRSKAGRLRLIKPPEGYKTIKESEAFYQDNVGHANQLVTVFENGTLLHDTTLSAVRERSTL